MDPANLRRLRGVRRTLGFEAAKWKGGSRQCPNLWTQASLRISIPPPCGLLRLHRSHNHVESALRMLLESVGTRVLGMGPQ
jgi:hypothetical protein